MREVQRTRSVSALSFRKRVDVEPNGPRVYPHKEREIRSYKGTVCLRASIAGALGVLCTRS
jgi:hypothetical protein